jgi:DNA phosphorothioation-dependent restriction protein DptG
MATVADGFRYAERVVSGDIVAGELVRLACQRFFHDLEHGPERGVYFDEGRAQHVLDFYNLSPCGALDRQADRVDGLAHLHPD